MKLGQQKERTGKSTLDYDTYTSILPQKSWKRKCFLPNTGPISGTFWAKPGAAGEDVRLDSSRLTGLCRCGMPLRISSHF